MVHVEVQCLEIKTHVYTVCDICGRDLGYKNPEYIVCSICDRNVCSSCWDSGERMDEDDIPEGLFISLCPICSKLEQTETYIGLLEDLHEVEEKARESGWELRSKWKNESLELKPLKDECELRKAIAYNIESKLNPK